MTQGPCGWVPTHTHFSAADAAEWATYSAEVQTISDAVGSKVLWAMTGRQFGACATIARPVLLQYWPPRGWPSLAQPWLPVSLGGGDWINFPIDQICYGIDPTRVKLRGPVNAVTSVTIGGVLFAAANYRVDEGELLVRTDGDVWPLWQDTALPGTDATAFVVNYTAGIAIPADLLAAAGTYALEYARALAASTACRLPSRAKSITRQGVTIDMVDPTTLLENKLTGLPEIDTLINIYNPWRYVHQPRVLVPGDVAPEVSA